MRSIELSGSVTRCAASLFFFLQTGCIVLDEEHCLANGGDLACPGQLCLLETGQEAGPRTDVLGCTRRPRGDRFHLHLKYGLPAEMEMLMGDSNMDSVEGILVAVREDHGIEDSCPLNSAVLQDELDEVIERHVEIDILRARMEKPGRILASPAELSTTEMQSVDAYNTAVDAWLDACLEKAASEMQ